MITKQKLQEFADLIHEQGKYSDLIIIALLGQRWDRPVEELVISGNDGILKRQEGSEIQDVDLPGGYSIMTKEALEEKMINSFKSGYKKALEDELIDFDDSDYINISDRRIIDIIEDDWI